MKGFVVWHHPGEIHSIVDDLSARLGQLGDEWLEASEARPRYFEFTPIELHAVTRRLQLAEPTASANLLVVDLASTVDFLSRVKNLKIRGSRGYVRSSNILCNSLEMSLHFCKSLLALWIADYDVRQIEGLAQLRRTLRRLVVHYSMRNVKDLFGVSELEVDTDGRPWPVLEDVDLSFNQLDSIDDSITTLKAVTTLNLSQNRLADIGPNLQHMPALRRLDLSKNILDSVSGWAQLLGNITTLNIAGNQIPSLEGLSKLYSLEVLDASENQLDTVESVIHVGRLPCLETLILRGNPVRKTVEYRTRILEAFEERAAEITLDSRRANERERDTIAVRLALRRSREEKERAELARKEKIERSVRYISGCDGTASDTSPYGSFQNTL
ncbi:unnamed protein product, partial [Mesorhabditis spiculigera]